MEDNYERLFYSKTLKSYLPGDLIKEWSSIYELLNEGYNDYEPELEHDLSLRDIIKKLIEDEELRQLNSHKDFILEIENIDLKIKSLVFPNPKLVRDQNFNWWDTVILKKGGPVYVGEIKKLYGIDIDEIQ